MSCPPDSHGQTANPLPHLLHRASHCYPLEATASQSFGRRTAPLHAKDGLPPPPRPSGLVLRTVVFPFVSTRAEILRTFPPLFLLCRVVLRADVRRDLRVCLCHCAIIIRSQRFA